METTKAYPFELEIQFFADGEEDETTEEVTSEEVSDSEEADEAEEDESQETEEVAPAVKADEDGGAKSRDRAKDAEYAKKRREAEKAAKEKAENENLERLKREAYDQGRIEGIGGVNPYTKQPIKTAYDLHLYDLMKESDKEGKNPLEDLPAKLALEQERAEKAKADEANRVEAEKKAAKERLDLANRNIDELGKTYPKLDRQWFAKAYQENKQFRTLLDHGFTPKQAVEFLGLEKQQEAQPVAPTPSSVPDGNAKVKTASEDDDAFIKRMQEQYGSFY